LALNALSGSAFAPHSSRSFLSHSSSLVGEESSHRRLIVCHQASPQSNTKFKHALAILAMPYTSMDRIANELILTTVLPRTDKLSVVLRCEGAPSLVRLRQYVGEVYSQLWDCALYETDGMEDGILPDIVVYPQNLPNTAPESWIDIQPDLEAVCSHDTLTGWVSEGATGRGVSFKTRDGMGGLDSHVQALNAERRSRHLPPVVALPVDEAHWPDLSQDNVIFVDDEPEDFHRSPLWRALQSTNGRTIAEDEEPSNSLLLGGVRMPNNQKMLYESVCVGGTFDGLHFGHRKLLTLAVSSVNPFTGRLLVGVTVDAMLRKKEYAEYLPVFEERCAGVRQFLSRLAPGMMNRVQIVPISDAFGPPGKKKETFDALVLSHETLETGYELNRYRVEQLGLPALKLLCTRRTEARGMSSTALRKLRSQHAKATPTI
jgi:cytidyltransferase-like protein